MINMLVKSKDYNSFNDIDLEIEKAISGLLKTSTDKLKDLQELLKETSDYSILVGMKLSQITNFYDKYRDRELTGDELDDYFFSDKGIEFWQADLKPIDHDDTDMLLGQLYFKLLPNGEVPMDKLYQRAYDVTYSMELRNRVNDVIKNKEYLDSKIPVSRTEVSELLKEHGDKKTKEKQILFDVEIKNMFLRKVVPYFKDNTRKHLEKFFFNDNSTTEMVFYGNMNLLADAFKKIHKLGKMTKVSKKDLAIWMENHFSHNNGTETCRFSQSSVKQVLGEKSERAPRKPLFIIGDGVLIPY